VEGVKIGFTFLFLLRCNKFNRYCSTKVEIVRVDLKSTETTPQNHEGPCSTAAVDYYKLATVLEENPS
jgi:hypothetical protein